MQEAITKEGELEVLDVWEESDYESERSQDIKRKKEIRRIEGLMSTGLSDYSTNWKGHRIVEETTGQRTGA